MPDGYKLYVNEERTVLVRIWFDGTIEVCTRATPEHTWGPPTELHEEA